MNFPTRCRASFTLLELLLVVGVACALIFAAVQGIGGVVQSIAVTTGAANLNDALNEGRSLAVAQNATVEVRLYDVPPQPGAVPAYDALQVRWLKADGTTPPAAPVVLLSSWVAIDGTAAHSTLIASNTQSARADATDARLNAQTRVFHFMPDGSTDLNPATNWFLTVRAASQSDPARFPANWACVRVDAATGRTSVYRP